MRKSAKVYHMAAKMNDRGEVSALCYKTPRAIDLAKASWVLEIDRATCPRCKAIARVTAPTAPWA